MNPDFAVWYNMAVMNIRSGNMCQAKIIMMNLMYEVKTMAMNKTSIPNCILNLMVYWHLREGNTRTALQFIKHRRVVTPANNGGRWLLDIVK